MEIQEEFNTLRIVAEMITNLEIMKNHIDRGQNEIDLRVKRWISPMAILPIAVLSYIHNIYVNFSSNKPNIRSYLNLIRFPRGTQEFTHRGKSYLPISKLPCSIEDNVLSKYEDMILQNIQQKRIRSPLRNSLKYLTSELVTNVREHAQVDEYWILAQYWPRTKTCEIAIADTGIGYRQSYIGTEFEVETHYEAILNAIQGRSSKDPIERGTGIPSMVNIFCKGYGGEIIIMSGDSLIRMKQEEASPYSIDTTWNGAFIGIRFRVSDLNPLVYLSSD